MTRVAVLSANLGAYDPVVPWVPQTTPAGVDVQVHRLTDVTFPPRVRAMTSRLQCGIPKMCGFELFPGYDVYVWVDASRGLLRSDTVAWFLDTLGGAEMLLFRHPERSTVREEYEFVKTRMARPRERYLTSRYAGEWLDEQYAAINVPWFTDNALYASTALAYRPTMRVKAALREWFYFKARYLLHDQLALPYVVQTHRVRAVVTNENVYTSVHLPMTR